MARTALEIWRAGMRWLRRRDGLFVRMLILQATLAIGLSLLYFGLYFVERNRTVATLLADSWVVGMAEAAHLSPKGKVAMPLILKREDLPEDAHSVSPYVPRFHAIQDELGLRGIKVLDMAWQHRTSPPTIWMKVRQADGRIVWLGVAGPLVEEREGIRLLGLFVLATSLVLLLSWMPARRMTRRLERLRRRINSGRQLPAEPPSLAATPEIVDIESAYDQLLAQVQAQHRERALLLAGVSHDLRSPLSRIRMAAELLPDDAAHASRRSSIIANVVVADRLIGDFLDFVRSTEAPMTERVDVSDCACRVARDLDLPDQVLRLDAADQVILPCANRHLLERAVFNLIDNALRHGRSPVDLKVAQSGQAVSISVHDLGPGMPPDGCEALLQPFARGDASRSRPGSGLGLAVVKQVVDRLGGRIEFEGGPGDWTVRLVLPARISGSS